MATDPKTLFASLKAGDLLMAPMTLPTSKEELTAFSAVLRIGETGELYLSRLSEHHADSVADAGNNPYRWIDEKGALINSDGDVPRWYSVNIQLERAGAKKAAAQYAQVPRAEQCRHRPVEADFKAFMDRDARLPLLSGIVKNGETGSASMQLSLALDTLGIAHTQEQLVGLSCFLAQQSATRSVRLAIISLQGDDSTSDGKAAAT